MHFVYKYVPHAMEKMQEYIDYIFYEIWCKAPLRIYDIKLYAGNGELEEMITALYYSDTKSGDFFLIKIEEIYDIFRKLISAQINQLKIWYQTNNEIEKLCCKDLSISPITYREIESINSDLAKKLELFYKSLYNHSFLSLKAIKMKIGDISDHFDSFMKDNTKGKCPYCGLNDLKGIHHTKREAYDHYLPKDIYPFNSINFKNLAPACYECNSSYKLGKDPLRDRANYRRKAFYSYSLEEPEMSIELGIVGQDLNNLTPDDLDLKFNSSKHYEEIETWKELFGIEERYKAKCLGETAQYWKMQVLDEMDEYGVKPDEALEKLKRQAKKFPFQDANFLKIPFLEECAKKKLFG